MADRYFEDFQVGETFESEGITMTESSIIDFAMMYDPQPIHLNVEEARAGPYGGLIASGIQSLAVSLRLWLNLGLLRACSLGSPGVDELRWLKPVRAGDTLRVTTEVTEVKPSSSKPDRGMVRLLYSTYNQAGEKVMTYSSMQLLRRRPA
jgi:acyl dehydratase